MTVVGWCVYCVGDEDFCEIRNRENGQLIWRGQSGAVATRGHMIQGPGLGGPVVFRGMYCQSISDGATLFIYTLL